ncbi:MAG: glucosyl-dolichyl phosphate glucuronosyltransferase [Candidatus Binataceae bacterium]|nr:glucosyl-dolichyl phosphate glucuronosyltransferase [Candidatus Binataceae bacterium]
MSTPLTIAVPTHNRARLLAGTLTSIAALKFPEVIIPECLIVDNNSLDDTRDAVEVFVRTAPIAVRYVIEPQLGSSYARNRAIAEARGEYVLFIDDDAIAEPDWAIEMLGEMERRHLDAACGIVVPSWERPPPRWLGPSLYVRLAVHDEAAIAEASPPERDHIHHYFSANVGFRRETFELFGNFREDLGVVGNNPISGEDTELFARIATCGGAIGFASRARVHHVIGRERMTRRYLRRKAYAFGFGSAISGGPTHNHLDKLARNGLRMLAAATLGNVERAVYHELECANFFGYWRGRLALRR